MYHSTLALRVIQKKKSRGSWSGSGVRGLGFGASVFGFRGLGEEFRAPTVEAARGFRVWVGGWGLGVGGWGLGVGGWGLGYEV